MQTLTKRTGLRSHYHQTIFIRQFSNAPTIIKPRRNTPIEHDYKPKSPSKYPSKQYQSMRESRQINVYDKVSNIQNDESNRNIHLPKKMRKKSKSDISANFLHKNQKDDNIHGIIETFEEDPNTIDNEYWYNNPQHIKQVEQFFKQKKLRYEQIPLFETKTETDNNNKELKTSYVIDDVIVRDKLRKSNPTISKRNELKLNRKLKLKERGNNENVSKMELIKRNTKNDYNNNELLNYNNNNNNTLIKNENEDISLKIWDPIKKQFTHSPTPQLKLDNDLKKKNKLKNKYNKYIYNNISNMEITDLMLANVPKYWLTIDDIDPVILDQLSHRLPLSSRHFCKTPQGLYRMNNNNIKILQKILVSEYWPSGWAEKQDEQIYAQKLFNSVSVKYDKRMILRYIANEFPLSLSVNYRILRELKHRMPDFEPKGMIDFGQGCGCSTLAAIEVFGDNLKSIYGIEPSFEMRQYATKIFENYTNKYHMGYLNDLNNKTAKEQPLIICSFVLSEITGGIDKLCQYLDELWLSTRKILIFIEAGTADGFNLINFARSYLLAKYPPSNTLSRPGTYTIAPCPHDKQCPLESKHICRFIQRIDRHQVPTRCHFKANKNRTTYIEKKNKIRGGRKKKVKISDKRKVNEIQFPYSYCILGKGISPRLISNESNIFSKSFPHYFMDNKQTEQASYFWPRIIAPQKFKKKSLYLHLCLPDIPGHVQENNNNKLISTGSVCGRLKLDNKRKNSKHHINIQNNECIDEKEYGYLEKWLITKSDNKLQMYQDAKRSKWGDLWPWQSPNIIKYPSLRTNIHTKDSYKLITRYSRPRFRDYFQKFQKDCKKFINHKNHIDVIYDDKTDQTCDNNV